MTYKLIQGDCLEKMQDIQDKSVDMILCDLPYGTLEHQNWDKVINLETLWKQYERIIKDSGAIVLFGAFPFSASLCLSNIKLFKYSLVWQKSKAGGSMMAPYRFLKEHEDILIFSKGKTTANGVPKMNYYPQGTIPINKICKNGTNQSSVIDYTSVKNPTYLQTVTNYPKSILKFNNEGKSVHPTQKPVALLEYLIKTYTNEGELVLDNTMGSGSTGVAAQNTNRNFIGIEKEEKYFEIAKNRMEINEISIKVKNE
jgi:site-specific DNA-methyltransferase (adenine-specific)